MAAALRRAGLQRDPIIVDRASGVVLDGMHRLSAFRILRTVYVVCDLIDYCSPSITLGRWLRAYRLHHDPEALKALAVAGLGRKSRVSVSRGSLDNGRVPVAAFMEGQSLIPASGGSIDDGFEIVRRLDVLARQRGWDRSFVPEEQLDAQLAAKDEAVVVVRRLGKRDVLSAGTGRRPFPCKTSMHVVDPRPVGVNFPLGDLARGTDESVQGRLTGRSFKILPPGTFYGGRQYEEHLMLMGPE